MKYRAGVRLQKRVRWIPFVLAAVLLAGGGLAYWMTNKSSDAISPTKASVEVADIEHSYSARIVFLGDTMLGRVVGPAILAGDDPFKHVRPILDTYDFRAANIESVIADPAVATTPASKRYTFNAPLGVLEAIKGVPIDLSILANNHTGDFGRASMLDMLLQFDSRDLAHTGLGKDIDEAFEPYVFDLALKGSEADSPEASIRLAVIAFNDFENVFSDAGIDRPGSAFFDKARLKSSLDKARAAGAELIFAVPHWGAEFRLNSFIPRQQEIGRWLIDNGADAVIGGHPHVIQPTEIYEGKPIIYSIGNFVFSGMESIAHTGRGQMAGFEISRQITHRGTEIISSTEVQLSEPIYHYYNLDLNGYPIPE